MSHEASDKRSPLEIASAIAERFMNLPPRRTYMYGFGLIGVLELWSATREQRYLDFYLAQRELAYEDTGEPRFDWHLWAATGDSRWIEGAEELGEKFLAEPRRDREGALLDPRGRYTVDVFSGYISEPIVFGHLLGDHRFFDEAVRQYEIYRDYLEEPQTGVWYSRWGHGLHPNRPNPGLWARGNGWLAGAWADTEHLWDPSHSGYELMLGEWQRFCRSIAAFQTPSGLFRQLLNREDCFEEATGSGLFCTAFATGLRHGTLPEEFGPIAYRTFCGLRGIVDEEGNIHNVSTDAGGYNGEHQDSTCPRYNEPHGDGTVMRAFIAMHMLQKEQVDFDTTEPERLPHIITEAVPGLLSTEAPESRSAEEIAPPVVRRTLALEDLPEHDLYGSTILGLLHWYDHAGDAALLTHARELFERCREALPPAARWNVAGEIALRTGEQDAPEGLPAFLDAELNRAPRDRTGVFLDEAGGYTIDQLYVWLPLLAKAGAMSGEVRYFDEACTQLFGHQRWLEDPVTHLWHSAFGHGAHPRRVTPGLWTLGNGYCIAGIVGLLEHLPREHDQYVDVICLVRRCVEVMHEYLPVSGGYRQLLDDLNSFSCIAGTALVTSGCARAIVGQWAQDYYYWGAGGGLCAVGELVDAEGNFKFSSRPTGGLDTPEAYEEHRLENDPSALGFILSACAHGAELMKPGMDSNERDEALGAR